MNSLIQSLYLTPQLREFIYQLPLHEPKEGEDIQKWDIAARKFKILKAFQNLFGSLQEGNTRDASTVELTNSFGWSGGQANEQHDIHELNRVLMDALEQVLAGTQYDGVI